MRLETSVVVAHAEGAAGYRILELRSPAIAAAVQPGQFVHLQVPGLEDTALRRPFSVFRAAGERFSVLYKTVGRGTAALARVAPGQELSVLGPLGNGFPLDPRGAQPVLVAGGYGVAPLCFLAARLPMRGTAFVGGASRPDLLCLEDFAAAGWTTHCATEDGSAGARGLVTAALDEWLAAGPHTPPPVFYVCGPDGLLKAVGERAIAGGWRAWLSLDRHLGCGVGACLACVQRVRRPDGSTGWARVCRDGPVFEAREIVWP